MAMIALFTDFGIGSPYVGQVHAVLARDAPGVPVIDLCNDLAPFRPRAAAVLLPAFATQFPADTVFLGVVDPGVGSTRGAVVVRAGGQWFVGPDNGLCNEFTRRDPDPEWWDITWRPDRLSATFHGRDLFAPVAARIAQGDPPPGDRADPRPRIDFDSPPDLAEVAYIDRYGNAVTGLRSDVLSGTSVLMVAGRDLRRRRAFSDVPVGEAFWYANSIGLAEIAVNSGNAAMALALKVGDAIGIRESDRSSESAP